MKEEWKVYIRGNKDRGKEVIKALTDLVGGTVSLEGSNKDCIYFIDHDGTIDFEYLNSETAKIIMNDYKEIKLSGQWSDGDILIRKDNNNLFCVYQKPADNGKGFLCHVYVTKDVLFAEVTVPTDPADNYRKATDSEKLTFYSLIDNHHMRWNAEKKQLVDWKWKPKVGESYFFIDSLGDIHKGMISSYGNKKLFDSGNYFQTKEEAEAMTKKIKKLLKENHEKTKENS